MSTAGRLRLLLVVTLTLLSMCLSAGSASAVTCPPEGCGGGEPPANPMTLTLHIVGQGTIRNEGVDVCKKVTCELIFEEGESVSLTAVPPPGVTFIGWSDDCSGTAACPLLMNGNRMVTATFPPESPTVTFPAAGEKIESANGEVNVKFTDFDGSANGFRCRIDVNNAVGASPCSLVAGWNTGPLAAGPHTVYVWAEDSAGNRSAPGSSAFEIVSPQDSGGGGTPPPGIGAPLPTERIRPPVLPATGRLSARWRVQGARTYVRKLLVTELSPRGRVQVRCTGTGCPFNQKKAATSGDRATVTPLFGKHALHAGAVIELRIGAPGMTTKVFVLKIRSGKVPKLIRR